MYCATINTVCSVDVFDVGHSLLYVLLIVHMHVVCGNCCFKVTHLKLHTSYQSITIKFVLWLLQLNIFYLATYTKGFNYV